MPSGRWRRVAGRLWPTLVAVAAAALVAGIIEAAAAPAGVATALAAAGFPALAMIPLGAVLAVAARALFAAWRFDRLCQGWIDDRGGAPRLAGWLVAAIGLAFASSLAIYLAMSTLVRMTSAGITLALGATGIALAVGLLAVAVSRPAADGLTWLLARADRRLSGERSLLGVRRVVAGAAVLVLAIAWLAWAIAIRPRIGAFDLGIAVHPAVFAAVCIAVHLAWPRLAHRRLARAVASGAVAAAAAMLAFALWTRYQRPFVMLEVWGAERFPSLVIDQLYTVSSLRDGMQLEEVAPAARPGAAHPDIVLITIDTMRADRTPPYGGPAPMPSLAALARESIVFESALAPSNVTRRSMPGMMMGLSPPRVRGRVVGWALRLDPRHVLLAERLAAAGYETAGFFCCESHFSPTRGLGLSRGMQTVQIHKDGRELTRLATRWLAARHEQPGASRRPLFLWLHYFDLHAWESGTRKLKPPVTDPAARRRWRYDWVLGKVDSMVGDLVRAFAGAPVDRGRIVIITSDHGEALGEHGFRTHATSLYNAELHVPLVIAGTGRRPTRVARPVGLIDLAPTILDLAGFVPPGAPVMDGASLVPLINGDPGTDRPVHAYMMKDRSVASGARAIVADGFKLIVPDAAPGRPELYDLARDPAETNNLARSQSTRVKTLTRALDERARLDAIPPF